MSVVDVVGSLAFGVEAVSFVVFTTIFFGEDETGSVSISE